MKQVIVTTTAQSPHNIHDQYARIPDWELVVVGDHKNSTQEWREFERAHPGMCYLSPSDQQHLNRELSDLIGWNCVQRRNFGFLYACTVLHADLIATVDDDHLPIRGWPGRLYLGKEIEYQEFIMPPGVPMDPLQLVTGGVSKQWHRGFPPQYLDLRDQVATKPHQLAVADIQVGLWYGTPDIDALGRLLGYEAEIPVDCRAYRAYQSSPRFGTSNPSPFGSHNAILVRKCFPDYFLFPRIGRMDDIWAAYLVEALGHFVVYTRPTVTHLRHPHDTLQDVLAEALGTYHTPLWLKLLAEHGVQALDHPLCPIPPGSRLAYRVYREAFT